MEELARDESFLREVGTVYKQFQAYMTRQDTYGRLRGKVAGVKDKGTDLVAYFSAEFGFHESVPNYSGGLGILSGDHCKSASDLDLNFCAVGCSTRHGYFKQQINKEGWQDAVQLNQNLQPARAGNPRRRGQRRTAQNRRRTAGAAGVCQVWKLAVGRINLYLLDTDIPENNTEDRAITAQLYGGDLEMRIRQEIVLGMGGPRALAALGSSRRSTT